MAVIPSITATISTVFVLSLLQISSTDCQWVDETLTGSVEAGKFTHYSLSKPGRVVITLTPKHGDPDVYVAENGTEPDVLLDRHSYQSTTCGTDRVIIPPYALRPIGIGVYGHPSYEYSVYELHVRVEDLADEYDEMLRAESTFESIEEEANQHETGHHSQLESEHAKRGLRTGSNKGSSSSSSSLTTHGHPHSEDPGHDTTDWDDWEEFPVYNILLTLLRLFWEMLLTL